MILINPPSPFLQDEKVFPYLGILQIATMWRNRGIEVMVQDLNGDKKWRDTIRSIASHDMIFGISSTSAQFKYAYEINRIIKKENPRAHTIIGGSHATAISHLRRRGLIDINTRTLEEFDTIVEGDGEYFDKTNRKWIAMPNIDIRANPIADRNLMDIESYTYKIDGRFATTIMTQRGCPFKCEFCSGREIDMYRKVRQREPWDVIEEMDRLNQDYGYSAFMWFDDEININPERLEMLCNLLSKRDYKHRGFVRADLIDRFPETLDHLQRAGFMELCSGVESGSDRILKIIGKNTTDETNRKVATMIKDKGIRYKAFTLVGHPSETYEDAMMTKKFLMDIKPDSFDVNAIMPYPGSMMYDNAKPSGKFEGYKFEYKGLYFNRPDFSKDDAFYKGQGIHPCYTRTDELTTKDINSLRQELLSCT
jgi:radical SAM superfamily enzyme YgiQ (UPF0313 family)